MNKRKFIADFKKIATQLFKEAANEYNIFEFGIFTDQDISTVIIAFNTYEHFAKSETIKSENRWLMPEWFGELGEDNEELTELGDRIAEFGYTEYEKGNEEYKEELLDLLFTCLNEMREEGIFDSMADDFILYLQAGDTYIGESMRQRIKQLIGEKYFDEFIREMKEYFY